MITVQLNIIEGLRGRKHDQNHNHAQVQHHAGAHIRRTFINAFSIRVEVFRLHFTTTRILCPVWNSVVRVFLCIEIYIFPERRRRKMRKSNVQIFREDCAKRGIEVSVENRSIYFLMWLNGREYERKIQKEKLNKFQRRKPKRW